MALLTSKRNRDKPVMHVLIDYENVSQNVNSSLSKLQNYNVYIWLFVGYHQTLSNALKNVLANFEGNYEIVRMDGVGKNALDFQLVGYLVDIAIDNPKDSFAVLSKDKGYDPFIRHLMSKKINVYRQESIEDLLPKTYSDSELKVIQHLKKAGVCKPKKLSTLLNTIYFVTKNMVTEQGAHSILSTLQKERVISINCNEAISYHF